MQELGDAPNLDLQGPSEKERSEPEGGGKNNSEMIQPFLRVQDVTFAAVCELVTPGNVFNGRIELHPEAVVFFGTTLMEQGPEVVRARSRQRSCSKRWVADSESSHCQCAKEDQGWYSSPGKHHCRRCGGVVCSDCL